MRLHQPSAFYGVSSRPLGEDAIDSSGTNEGFYELAGADEIRAYYQRVLTRDFLPTGRVRYFPSCDYVGEHRFVSRLSDASWQATVRRKIVDAAFLEGEIPNGAAGYRDDPVLIEAKKDIRRLGPLALANLIKLLAE